MIKFLGQPVYSMTIGKDFITVVLKDGNGMGGECKVLRGEDFQRVMKLIEKPLNEALKKLS